jgi:hypothetical protein
MKEKGEEIFYKFPPKDMPYDRKNVVKFRRPFLAQRKREVEAALEHMKKLAQSSNSSNTINSDPLRRIVDVVDWKRVAVGGHSFGGASTIHLNAGPSVVRPRCIILHDPWPFCVSEEDVNRGLNKPTLCMVGDRFRNSSEYAITENLIETTRQKNHVKVFSFHIKGATHSQFSDTPFWLPTPIGIRLPFNLLGKQHDPELVHEAIVQTTVSFLRRYCCGDLSDDDDDDDDDDADGDDHKRFTEAAPPNILSRV